MRSPRVRPMSRSCRFGRLRDIGRICSELGQNPGHRFGRPTRGHNPSLERSLVTPMAHNPIWRHPKNSPPRACPECMPRVRAPCVARVCAQVCTCVARVRTPTVYPNCSGCLAGVSALTVRCICGGPPSYCLPVAARNSSRNNRAPLVLFIPNGVSNLGFGRKSARPR